MKHWIKKKIHYAWGKLKPHPSMSRLQKNSRLAAIIIISGGLALGVILFFYSAVVLISLPNPEELASLNPDSTLIMDREGNLLYTIHGEENRESLESLDEISPWLLEATLSIEDDNFYHHIGIDFGALFKAVLSEIGIGSPRGGSTITQQFVKNSYLSPERTYKRKFKEILLSLLVELKFSKDEIALMYLNAIPYGSNAYGIELAAERYFEKSADELTLAESAILAGIPKAPTRYSPYGNYKYSEINFELTPENVETHNITDESDLADDEWTRGLLGKTFELPDGSELYLKGRSDLVLERMNELGYIDESEMKNALSEIAEIEFTPYKETIKAPHFVLWVKQQLEDKYGSEVVEQGGLKVYTTLDPDFQQAAEDAIENNWEHNNDSYGANNAAIVSIQPQTGQILAMVGSAEYFESENKVVTDGQVNMITANRQPGSSFKPFVYALAFLKQYTPATVLYDVETTIGGVDTPTNYDGEFWGPMTIRYALAQSRNIPAIKAYFLAGREDSIVPFVNELGIDSLTQDGNYGWPLALGTGEVTPLEMAEAYSVFANTGVHIEPNYILKIENADGTILEQWDEKDIKKEEVLDPQVAFLINDILSDGSVNLGPSIRIDSIDNASKTGTSNKELSNGTIRPNNAWLAAYTPTLVTITWAGNADGKEMTANAGGYNTAAPIWKDYITAVLDRLEPTEWIRPEGIEEVAISKASGKLAGENTPSEMVQTEVFASFAVPTEIDDAYQTVMIETVSGRLATEYSPEDVVEERTYEVHRSILADIWPEWQEGIDTWLANKEEESSEGVSYEAAPTEYARDIHNEITSSRIPELAITSPASLSAVSVDEKLIDIEVEVTDDGNGISEVEYSLNDVIQYHAEDYPYTGKVRFPTTTQEGDIIEVSAKAIDIYGYSMTSTIQLRIGDSSPNQDQQDQDEEPTPEGDKTLERALQKRAFKKL